MRKNHVQLYFAQRNPLLQQNQQYSTVYQINPTLQSQESMLQKIIYANNEQKSKNNEQKSKGSINMNKFRKKTYQFQLQIDSQQGTQIKRPIQQKINSTKYKYLHQQPHIEVNKKLINTNQFNPRKTSQSVQLYKQKKQNIQNEYQSKGIDRRVDQQKLRKIQNRINQYRKVGQTTERFKRQPFEDVTNHNHQLGSRQFSNGKLNINNLQNQTIANRADRRPSLISLSQNDNYSFGLKVEQKDLPNTSIKKQSKLNHFLEQIYYCMVKDKRKLSSQSCDLKNLPFQEIKFILGSIFTDIFVKNKTFTKQQFVNRSLDIFKQYNSQQTEKILKIFKLNEEDKNSNIRRKTGLVLKNSKSNYEEKRYLDTFIPQPTFSVQKPSKDVYMTNTHSDQPILSSYQKQYLCSSPLQTMYEIERNRKITYQRVDKQDWEAEDDQLRRLEGLEARFQQHFTQRK